MADSNLGTLFVPVETRLQPLEQGIKRAEVITKQGVEKIEKAAKVTLGTGNLLHDTINDVMLDNRIRAGKAGRQLQTESVSNAKQTVEKVNAEYSKANPSMMFMGKGGGGFLEGGIKIAAGIQLATTAFSTLNIGAQLFSGNIEGAREALFQMPLGIGQLARTIDSFLDGGQLEKIAEDGKKVNDQFQRTIELGKNRNAFNEKLGGRLSDLGFESAEMGLEGSNKQRADVNMDRFNRLQEIEKLEEEAKKLKIDKSAEFAYAREKIEEITQKKIAEIDKKEQAEKDKVAVIELEKERMMAEQALKIQEQQADQVLALKDQNDIDELRRVDMVAAEKLQIEKEADAAIRQAAKEGNAALIPEIERQRALRLAGVSVGAGVGSAAQIEDISRMVLGGSAGLNRGADEKPASKKQADTQIGVLRDMLNAITRLQFEATAN